MQIYNKMQETQQERHSWIKFGILMLFMTLYGLVNVMGSGDDINLNLDNPNMLLILKIVQVISVIIIFIAPALLIAGFWTTSKIHYLGFTKKASFSVLALAGIGILAALPMINWLAEVNKGMQLPEALHGMEEWMKSSEAKAAELTEAFTKGTSVGTLLLNLFVIAFMAALSEEIFFRGLFQKIAIECFKNKHVGVWFGAIIFSAFHMQFFGFVPRMLMGAYLGYLFLWTGSLWPGILAHFINNGTAVFLVWLVNRGVISEDVDKVGIQQGQMIYVAVSTLMVIGSLFLVYRIQKNKKTAEQNLQP